MKKARILGLATIAGLTALNSIAAPTVGNLLADELVGHGGRLPTIQVDDKDQPHIVTDINGECAFNWYSKIGGASGWTPMIADSGRQNGYKLSWYGNISPQFYNPHLEIRDNGVGVLSGVMWDQKGMGVVIIKNITTAPEWSDYFDYTQLSNDGLLPVGNISLDPNKKNEIVTYFGNGGRYSQIYLNAAQNGRNEFYWHNGTGNSMGGGLQGGEKNYFWVSKAGDVWHPDGTAHAVWHACTEVYYKNSTMGDQINWAPWIPSAAVGSDHTYPGMCGDSVRPKVAYMACDYNRNGQQGIVYNVFNGNNMVFGSNGQYLDLNGSSGAARFEPQLYPANKGGAWIVYSDISTSLLKLAFIDDNGVVTPQAIPAIAGIRADICVDSRGYLHIAYHNAYETRYLLLEVNGDSLFGPTYPVDTIADTTPVLKWKIADATSTYKVTLQDASAKKYLNAFPVSLAMGSVDAEGIFTYDPGIELPLGYYKWYIQNATYGDYSLLAEFSVAPKPPVVVAPSNGQRITGQGDVLSWNAAEGAAWYHIVGLFPGGGSFTDKWVQGPSTQMTLGRSFDTGLYRWWIQSVAVIDGQLLYGPWSEQQAFSIGIPGTPQPISPNNTSIVTSTTIPFTWTQGGSETNDKSNTWYYLLLRNAVLGKQVNKGGLGSEWFGEDGGTDSWSAKTDGSTVAVTAHLAEQLTPGLHKWWVYALDALGHSTWSTTGSFTVGRQIAPGTIAAAVGQGPEITETKPEFQWSAVSWAAKYKIFYVHNSDGVVHQLPAYGTIPAVPAQATQSYTPGTDLPTGNYNWWVQPISANGVEGSSGVSAAFQIVVPTT